ncbi:MAG: hypothetical protein K8R11_07185 [Methanococcoides sp.]|nr:hypothetical protein [Methanococcoides sp.]
MGLFDFLKGKTSQITKDSGKNSTDLHGQSMEYFQKAQRLYKNNEDYFPSLQEAVRFQLLNHQKNGIENGIDKVKIITAGSQSCKLCRGFEGMIITTEEALKNMPIPHKNCKHNQSGYGEGWCRCMYVAYVEEV